MSCKPPVKSGSGAALSEREGFAYSGHNTSLRAAINLIYCKTGDPVWLKSSLNSQGELNCTIVIVRLHGITLCCDGL